MSTRPAGCGEDVAAYALGALDANEARTFENHLAVCELCTADLKALEPAVAMLPASAEPVEPPAALKKRIMAVVESEARQRREAERPAKRRFTFRLAPALAAAAAAVAIAVVLISNGGDATQTIQPVAQPPGSKVELRMDDNRGTLVVTGMPALPAGRVYQVWKQSGNGAPQPTDALFTPTADGRASVNVPGGMEGVDQIMVSDEPTGGSRSPSTPPSIVVET
jgi:anti-sigma-K factor RskA